MALPSPLRTPDRAFRLSAVPTCAGILVAVAIDAGGALSGEHGIGLEKNHFMFWVFGPEDLDAQRRARDAFDPGGTMNPGKIFPGGDACADIPTERTKRALAEGMWV